MSCTGWRCCSPIEAHSPGWCNIRIHKEPPKKQNTAEYQWLITDHPSKLLYLLYWGRLFSDVSGVFSAFAKLCKSEAGSPTRSVVPYWAKEASQHIRRPRSVEVIFKWHVKTWKQTSYPKYNMLLFGSLKALEAENIILVCLTLDTCEEFCKDSHCIETLVDPQTDLPTTTNRASAFQEVFKKLLWTNIPRLWCPICFKATSMEKTQSEVQLVYLR